ncbi:hornerin-like [Chenopodium quinoa]|uniref:WRKY19-like zinc finger domain-containing protein n=1 Tax=Chenopodium quinoa TaxID=63459 RepID=A0A803MKF9_CHEQI|nr:hornerin-like [Chenopodium quinoa]
MRMNVNEKGAYFNCSNDFARNDKFGDTSLRLDCLGYERSSNSQFHNAQNDPGAFTSMTLDDGCRLVLGLGPTPRAYSENKQSKGSSSSSLQGLSGNGDSILKLGLSGETGNLFSSLDFSTSTQTEFTSHQFTSQVSVANPTHVPVADEGSTSAKQSGGYMPSLLLAPRNDCRSAPVQMWDGFDLGSNSSSDQSHLGSEASNTTSCTMGTVSEHSATLTSVDNRPHNAKRCRFMGCTKGARGASGLCIGHGGGQRCQKPGCNKGAESRTAYCKAHGGGRRCQHLGCTKSAEGKTDNCIAHGGGRRCGYPGGCSKAARGKSGLCIRHGGGKRCKVEGCTRSAEGRAGLCISHGGGRRCQYQNCAKGAQGSTMYCKAHGGGKRCIFAGCTKGAEGSTPLCKGHGGGKRCMFDGGGICPKSVHGGTNYCVAHGGGKRCAVPGCSKSARGRTDCCVKHGGGKRCKVENCGKSAQGSTDFCKAHGGGKRCSWGDGKCEKFARGRSGLCAAHSSMVQERENKRGLIGPGLFHGLVSTSSSTIASSLDNKNSSSGISVISDCEESLGRPAKRQHLIPPEVLVPLSMKSVSSYSVQTTAGEQNELRNGDSRRGNFEFLIPEGRVHGGGLMSFLGGNLNKNAVHGI